jgi:hypothetical protein
VLVSEVPATGRIRTMVPLARKLDSLRALDDSSESSVRPLRAVTAVRWGRRVGWPTAPTSLQEAGSGKSLKCSAEH